VLEQRRLSPLGDVKKLKFYEFAGSPQGLVFTHKLSIEPNLAGKHFEGAKHHD
jgi:hypothetical protein